MYRKMILRELRPQEGAPSDMIISRYFLNIQEKITGFRCF